MATVASAVLAVLLVVANIVAFRAFADSGPDVDYQGALDAATKETVAFTSLDYRHPDQNIARVLEGATGTFKKQFARSQSSIKQLADSNRSVSVGKVLTAGVGDIDTDSARVFVVADSMVSNKASKSPQPRHYRLQLDLVRKDGRWLTSNVQFVG